MVNLPVYMDNNATTACDPRVLEAMLPYFSNLYGNAASRSHAFGWQAEEAVDIGRAQVASLVGADPKEIVFTSGATEAVNLAIKGVFESYSSKGNHIIAVATEHKAVLDTCKHLEKKGAEISLLPVNQDGLLDLLILEAAIRPTTILIAVMFANNEVGVIQPIKEISAIARKNNIIFFSDASQAAGKVNVDVNQFGVDLLAFSAHKMYGPKGIGALYVRRKNPRVKLIAQMDGGGHERNMRSGTLNVPAIVGFGKACVIAKKEMAEEAKRLSRLRDKLETGLLHIEHSFVNGSKLHRLPHVTNMSFDFIRGESLFLSFNKELAVSSGSACTSATLEPSYVLKALGVPENLAHSSIRFGLGRFNTEEEIDFVIEKVTRSVSVLRESSPEWVV
ncbi:MAG: IscS subfamily cysteine desulfurase [Bacteroidetes bacterium]|nr:MAG: IscS subfamily cysteine desulfurase [Bacteroidota bacterium]